MKFKFACSDAAFPLLDHQKALRLIGMLEFEGVDIGLFEERSKIQPSMVLGDPAANGKRLMEQAGGEGLKIADVFYQAALDFTARAANHPEAPVRAAEREAFLKTLEYAAACQSGHVTCLPGVHYPQERYEDSFLRASEELAWRVERAQEAGIPFGVEAHVGSLVQTPGQAMRLLDATPGLTLTLDYTHFMRQRIPNEEAHPLIARASHFHARGAAPGRLQTVLAENAIDYPAIAAEMERAGYPGWFGIEYTWTEWEDCNKTDNLSETILLKEYMKSLEG